MELTTKKQLLKERREYVINAFKTKPDELAVTSLVRSLSKKFNVTEVTIYSDKKKGT